MNPSLFEKSLGALASALLLAPIFATAEPSPAPKKEVKLELAVIYTLRDGLPNAAEKLQVGGEVNVVFLGGSITHAAASPKGYVTFVGDWLKAHYPKAKINTINSGISGTGSDFGAARYDRDVLAKKPDLVFIEFCVNDGDSDRTDSIEKMVHKTWMKYPKTDIAIFYTLARFSTPRQKLTLANFPGKHFRRTAAIRLRMATSFLTTCLLKPFPSFSKQLPPKPMS